MLIKSYYSVIQTAKAGSLQEKNTHISLSEFLRPPANHSLKEIQLLSLIHLEERRGLY